MAGGGGAVRAGTFALDALRVGAAAGLLGGADRPRPCRGILHKCFFVPSSRRNANNFPGKNSSEQGKTAKLA